MPKIARIHFAPSSQNFLDISEIRQGVVILKNGGLRAILMCTSVNFALKSQEEQDALIFRYQRFLNSLDFPVQIVVNSRKLNLDNYLRDLAERTNTQTNELLKLQTEEYLEFVKNLIELSNIISKYFYVVVPYSPTETKKGFFKTLLGGLNPAKLILSQREFEEQKNQLWQRVKHIQVGLEGMEIRAEVLNTEELIELFYNLYNPEGKMKQTKLNVLEIKGQNQSYV